MMRVAIYARYSTDLQKPSSIADQIRVCSERANREEWQVTQIYQDAKLSGESVIFRSGMKELIRDAKSGLFDVVLGEALDRFSRDQADIAIFYKALRFRGVRIVTLSEGEVNELHIGMKGTMNALFLRDLAMKVRRGQRGRVEAGKSGGGMSYGYEPVRQLLPNGTVECGELEIIPAEAQVIQRIFKMFSTGVGPREIARTLNQEHIPGPRGSRWIDTTIRGSRKRGTGIINNELYVGRRVWNKLRYLKDPETGKRVSRENPPDEIVTVDVPELKIVDDQLWQAVKRRQIIIEQDHAERIAGARAFHQRNRLLGFRRPKTLLSGLVYCGSCGGNFSLQSNRRFGCSDRLTKGICNNRAKIACEELETRALAGLQVQMMQPQFIEEALRSYRLERENLDREHRANYAVWQAELRAVEVAIENGLNALLQGVNPQSLKDRLSELETEKSELRQKLAEEPPPYSASPAGSDRYLEKIRCLVETLNEPEAKPEAVSAIRSLIRKVIVSTASTPGEAGALILQGDVTRMVELIDEPNDKNSSNKNNAENGSRSVSSSVVAGAGFEPAAFRL